MALTVIMDHTKALYENCPENGLSIAPFKPQITITSNAKGINNSSLDKHLYNSMKVLVKLHEDQPLDIREYLKKMEGHNFLEL